MVIMTTNETGFDAVNDYLDTVDQLDGLEEWEAVLAGFIDLRNSAVETLEQHYQDRGLKFTVPFTNNIPNQAFGQIDGMLFYFRYRGDSASLRVGTIPMFRLEREHVQAVKRWKEDPTSPFGWKKERPTKRELNGVNDMPVAIKKESFLTDYTGEPLNSSLDREQMVDLFTKLVEALEDVDYEEPVIRLDPTKPMRW